MTVQSIVGKTQNLCFPGRKLNQGRPIVQEYFVLWAEKENQVLILVEHDFYINIKAYLKTLILTIDFLANLTTQVKFFFSFQLFKYI